MIIALGYILTFGWVFLVLGLTQVLKRTLRMADEASRKLVHIAVAFAWLPMYFCFGAGWHLLVPPAVMTALNYISYRTGLFSAMERADAAKQSPGTVYYALSMTVMALVSVLRPGCLPAYGAALFSMALADGLAPVFGRIKKGNRPTLGGRTLYGSLCVYCVTLLVLAVMTTFFRLGLDWADLVIVAVAATALELVGVRGLDNLTLPLGVFALLALLGVR